MIFSPWENIAEISVHKPMAVVVQDPLSSCWYIVEERVGLGVFWGGKFLGSGWETRFLLQTGSRPGSAGMKADTVLLFLT